MSHESAAFDLAGMPQGDPISPVLWCIVADLALEPRSLTAWDPTGLARFGWWAIIAYCFAAQAKICDDYFVPAIEACSKQFKIPQDVAGATLMAFGCNGPEMYVSSSSVRCSGPCYNLFLARSLSQLTTPPPRLTLLS